MQIKWFNRKGYYCPGDVVLKDEMGFYKIGYSNYTPKDIACFPFYSYIYRKVSNGVVMQEWCVKMEDDSFMNLDEAIELDRKAEITLT